MTPENFVYWLQGFMELSDAKSLNEKQIEEIKNHIALVLEKKTPVIPNYSFWSGNSMISLTDGNTTIPASC